MKARNIKYLVLSLSAALLFAPSGFSQGPVDAILDTIEACNPTLAALRAKVEADRAANRASTLPPDPEVEFNFLWGGKETGTRHDLRISEQLDLATVSGMRSSYASSLNNLSELQYKAERLAVLSRAKELCIDVMYYNSLISELERHREYAEELARACRRSEELGSGTVLETNKAELNLTTVRGDITKARIMRQNALNSLREYASGAEITLDEGLPRPELHSPVIDGGFEQWFDSASQRNPVLQHVSARVRAGEQNLRIQKASRLPALTFGYMDEIGRADKYRGLTFGISLPLWNTGAQVRKARAELEVAKAEQAEKERQFYWQLSGKYQEACGLREIAGEYRSSLERNDNLSKLLQAQKQGEISLVDYLMGADFYYEVLQTTLDAERDYWKALAELTAVDL